MNPTRRMTNEADEHVPYAREVPTQQQQGTAHNITCTITHTHNIDGRHSIATSKDTSKQGRGERRMGVLGYSGRVRDRRWRRK